MPIKKAIDVDGADAVSYVLMSLLNEFPGLNGKTVAFASLEETGGIGVFPTSGSVLMQDREDVTGHVFQVCVYPFNIIYRASLNTEKQRIRAKELLDGIGKWLERQPITVEDTVYQLQEYPALNSGNRIIKNIYRSSPAYFSAAWQDKVEDWAISMALQYENEFDR